MQKSHRGAQAGLSTGTLWTPDLPLSLGQEFVSPRALRGGGSLLHVYAWEYQGLQRSCRRCTSYKVPVSAAVIAST